MVDRTDVVDQLSAALETDPGAWAEDVRRAAELGDVLYVAVLEPEFRFQFVSPHVEQLLGHRAEEFLADPGLLARLSDLEDQAAFPAPLAAPVDTDVDATLRMRAKDGRLLWVAHHARQRVAVDGTVVAYGAMRDVTEQQETIARFAAAEERLQLVVRNAVDVLLHYTIDGVLLWASPSLQQVFGWEPEAVVGTRFRLAIEAERAENERLLRQAVATGDQVIDHRTRVATAAGEVRWTDTLTRLVRDDTGSPQSLVITVRDVTRQVETEEALLASEQRFRRAMADAAIGMCLVAPDGGILEVNPAMCRFFGRSAEDLLRAHWRDLTHPDDLEIDHDRLQATFDGDIDTYRVTKRYLHSDGGTVIGELSVSAIRDDRGRVSSFVSQIDDVTNRVAMERALAESEEHFRLLAENASDVVVRVANDGAVEWISQSVTNVTGWTPEELLGTHLIGLVHPDDLPEAQVADERTHTAEVLGQEFRIRTSTGTYRWFSFHVRPVWGPDGRLVARIGGWRDIDAEVQARRLAAQREAQFQMVAENTADVVFRLNPEGHIEWVSPSVTSVLGWEPEELLGRGPDDLVHPDDRSRVRAEVATLQDSAERGRFDERILRANGEYVWFSDITTLIRDSNGRPVGRVVGLRNVDAEVRARHALELSEQRFRLAMASAPSGMALVDLDRKFVQVNPTMEAISGRDAAWLVAHRVPDILPPEDQVLDLRMRALVLSGRVSSDVKEHRIERPDGSVVWVQHSLGLLRDDEGTPLSYISQFLDVTEARQARHDLEFIAAHDAMTRLANRRALIERMTRILVHRPRSGQRVGVLFLDLDGLKPVNDQYGHAAGDRVIIEVADLIAGAVRADDLVARFGGDEFVALLTSVTSLSDVLAVGDKIRCIVADTPDVAGLGLRVTVSVGGALAAPGDSPDELLSRADTAVYRAKSAGGNRTEVEPGGEQ